MYIITTQTHRAPITDYFEKNTTIVSLSLFSTFLGPKEHCCCGCAELWRLHVCVATLIASHPAAFLLLPNAFFCLVFSLLLPLPYMALLLGIVPT